MKNLVVMNPVVTCSKLAAGQTWQQSSLTEYI